MLKSTVSSRIPSFNIWKDLFSARANWVVSLPCCASACLEPQRTVLRDQCPPALLARRLSAMAARRESARACVRRPSEQSDDDRSSCSSGLFAEIIVGASGALRVQDLERGASSEFEGIVFDDSDGDVGDFCGLWKQKNSRRKQLEGKVRELESEVLEQLH